MEFDEFLATIGNFGKQQKIYFFLICLTLLIPPISLYIWTFAAAVPEHHCNVSLTKIPDNATCITRLAHVNEKTCKACYFLDENNDLKKCHSFVFDKSVFKSTLTEEWNMVCDRMKYQALIQSFYFAGYFVGSLALGVLSDIFGRRKIMGLCCFLMFGAQVVSTLTPGKSRPFGLTYGISVASRFFMGCAIRGLAVSGYVLVMEIVSTEKRSLAGIFSQYSFAIGQLIILLIAYFVRKWRLLYAIVSGVLFPFCFLCFFLPESPRWLLQRKKYDKAEMMLKKIARVNKREFDDDKFQCMIDTLHSKEKRDNGNVYSLIKRYLHSFVFLTILAILIYSWFIQNFIYYGISLSTGSWGVNEHLSFFLSAVSELLGAVLTQLTLWKFGKISSYCFFCVLSSVSSFLLIILRNHLIEKQDVILKVCAALAKLFISSSYTTLYIFSSELFPTPIRNSCMGLCSALSRLATILSVYVSGSTRHNISRAFIVYGVLSVSGGLLAVLLPETRNKTLPDDVTDLKLSISSRCLEKFKRERQPKVVLNSVTPVSSSSSVYETAK